MDDSRNRIHILPDNLVDVIAAGEVVERPASVVKELVENAIDAGAQNIQVYLEDGGRRKIQVTDDGVGMDEDDCLMAIERHATSKIATVDDLNHIGTLGFRGEALPSIAAVGRFTLESWHGKAGSGTRIVIDNGKLVQVEPVGRARGTTVTLEGLFRKLPARRKFLRTRQTETAWCLGAVEDAALANPAQSFTVSADGSLLLGLPPVSSLTDRIADLWGVDTARAMLHMDSTVEGIALEGLISPPNVTFSRRTRHKVIVNGRPVRDPLLNRVISSALAGSWPAGRFPALVVVLTVEDDLVDVNVHPAKREVRLRRTDHLAEALRRAVRGLRHEESAADGSSSYQPSAVSLGPEEATSAREEVIPFDIRSPWPAGAEAGQRPDTEVQSEASFAGPDGSRRILGQLSNSYILLEGKDGLEIIDQHAAHERIVFNRLMASRAGKGPPVQSLAVPLLLEMSPSESANLLSAASLLGSFGIELEDFGPSTVRVTAVPSDLKGGLVEELLRQLASDPEALGKEPAEVGLAVSRWACRDSVMAGRRLSGLEINGLIKDLEEAESGFSCPHGRPTRVTLTIHEIERLFGRK